MAAPALLHARAQRDEILVAGRRLSSRVAGLAADVRRRAHEAQRAAHKETTDDREQRSR